MSNSPEASPPELIGCPDCGLLQTLPRTTTATFSECARCARGLSRPVLGGIDLPLACALAALLLLLPAVLSPLMQLTSFGMQRRTWMPTGVALLWSEGFTSLATFVGLLSIAIPFIYFGLLICVLSAIRWGVSAPLGRLFRWAEQLQPWAMIEVYLLGCCVAYSRLQAIGTISVGIGGWCLMGAALAAFLATINLDEHCVWNALSSGAPRAGSDQDLSARPLSCNTCGLVLDAQYERRACPRCEAVLYRRKPYSVQRTIALVIAGFVLYIPANVLPILNIERFGRDQPNTILSGVRELVTSGLWPLAVLVFTASIIVPLVKLLGLALMLVLTHRRSPRWLMGRTRLYRFIDFIGRWSSIDLFMISVLAALVRFGALTTVRPEPGAIAFGAVIMITMFASRGFDPRIMWDAGGAT